MLLKRVRVDVEDIIHVYASMVRYLLQYVSEPWHPGLTTEQSN